MWRIQHFDVPPGETTMFKSKFAPAQGLAITAAALALSFCGSVLAQAQPDPATAKQACAADLKTYCSGVQPGGGRIKACLQQNADKLSPACTTALQNAKAARQNGG
jgi:hypothetical protein